MTSYDHPNIKGTFVLIDDTLFAKTGIRSVSLKDWIGSSHFKRGAFGTKCLLMYMSGTQSSDSSFMESDGNMMQQTWEVQFPIIASDNTDMTQDIQNLIGGMAQVCATLAKGDSISGVVGCDQNNSLENDFERQEPLDDRLMLNWGVLTFPQVTIYCERMILA